MKDEAKCFIKIKKGYYEEITYKELNKRREEDDTYKNKLFIPVQNKLIEVSKEEYHDFYKDVERMKYVNKSSKNIQFFSVEKILEDSKLRKKFSFVDAKVNIELEVERKNEIECLKNALLELDEEEYKIIKALFFDEKSLRKYAKEIGISFTTLESKKQKIIKKLKIILNI